MGNRAVITTEEYRVKGNSFDKNGIGIYLHWDGSPEDIEGFLRLAKEAGIRKPENDDYGWARLCQIIANDIGGVDTGIGINTLKHLDCNNGDNGVYVIKDWEIVEHFDEITFA